MKNCPKRMGLVAPVLFGCALAWLVLLVNPGSIVTLVHCVTTPSGSSPVSFRMLFAMNPVSSLAAGWALMLVAMMAPTLITPLRHVVARSFTRRGPRAIALFLLAYAAVWMAAGSLLLTAQLVLGMAMPQSWLPAVGVGLVAFVWQCAPLKQRCLNRGHNHRALAAFGREADLDVLRFGINHAVWCVGSCWALMLFPMLLPLGHLAGMAAVTILTVSERLESPRPPVWCLRGPGKLVRIVIAQSRMRFYGAPVRPHSGLQTG